MIKQNVKAKLKKQSYANGNAKMVVAYMGSAIELWDELPKVVKQPFKLASINDRKIELQKSTTGVVAPAKTDGPLVTTTKSNDDCKTCAYFPLCDLTDTRNFDGVPYKVFNATNGKFYMYCKNGNLVQKREFTSGGVTDVTTQTLIKHNETVGANWEESTEPATGSKRIYRFTIMAKAIPMTVKGKAYNDVLAIYHKVSTRTGSSPEVVSIPEVTYYAKDVGPVGKDDVDVNYDPVKRGKEMRDFAALYSTLKGDIDKTMAGIWKHHSKTIDMDMFYKFNQDGTYEYYAGSVNAANQMPKCKCYWRLDGAYLDLLCTEWSRKQRLSLQKKNDAATCSPTLLIEFNKKENRTYFSENNKVAWK